MGLAAGVGGLVDADAAGDSVDGRHIVRAGDRDRCTLSDRATVAVNHIEVVDDDFGLAEGQAVVSTGVDIQGIAIDRDTTVIATGK